MVLQEGNKNIQIFHKLQILEHVWEGYIGITSKGAIFFANRAAQKTLSLLVSHDEKDRVDLFTVFSSLDTQGMTCEQFIAEMIKKSKKTYIFSLKRNTQVVVGLSYYPYEIKEDNIIDQQETLMILRISNRHHLDFQQNQLFTSTFEALPLPQAIVDSSLQIIMVNQAFETHFDVMRKEAIGLTFGDAIQCINSEERGCGHRDDCKICKFRQVVGKLVTMQRALKDHLVKLECAHNKAMWLNVNLVPIEHGGATYSLLTLQDITDRFKADQHIEEARQLSIALLEGLPTLIYQLDGEQKCHFVNRMMQEKLEVTKDTFYTYFKSNMTEDAYSLFMGYIKQVYQKKQLIQFEVVVGKTYAEQKRYYSLLKPLANSEGNMTGVISLMLDVHEESILKYLYIQSKHKYEAIFKHLNMGIGHFEVVFDDDQRVDELNLVEFNQALSSIYSQHLNLFPKQKLSEVALICQKDLWWFYRQVEEILNTTKVKQLEPYYSEALDKWLEISVYSPEENFVSLLVKDVDKQYRLAKDLERAIENSEAANRSKSDFLANMSHEIRTPLNGIVGMIDLTLMDEMNEEQRDNLKTAKSCVNNLMTIINDVLDFSKIEAGKLKIDPSPFDLMRLIAEVTKAHIPHAKAKQIKLITTYGMIYERTLMGDESRIKQILNNFLSNAIKFTQKGQVNMHVSQTQAYNRTILEIKIVDTGIGISDDKKELLFQRFSQIDSSFTREYGGTGLGLVITKQLIELMGGKLWFESKEGIGSTFAFTLPLLPANPHVGDMALNTVAFSKDKKILIVEDDVVNQLVIGKMIENMGINFEIAEHGKEAVAYCKRQSYDLILMDIQMPEMDGIQATKYIRRSEKNASVPIIALTAFALSGDEALFKASGMDDFLPKPIKIESLNNVLSTYLSHKRARESDDKAVGGRAFASVETTAVNPRDTTLKKQANEALSKVNYLNHLFEEKNYLIIEVFAHQLKTYFNELEFEELKILTFKMERAIRREDYEEAHQNLLAIMDIIKIFNDANTREVEDD